MSEEIWRDISGYEGHYQVSSFGRVKSFYHGGRILKPGLVLGYLKVNLHSGGKVTQHKVHRLVAAAFIPNPDGKPEVNHINGIKTDNRVENLEWATPSENQRHAVAIGLKKSGEDRPDAKLTNEQARFIRDNPAELSIEQLAAKFGVGRTTISQIQRGKTYKNAVGTIRKTKPRDPRRFSNEICEQICREYVPYSRERGTTALAKKYGCNPQTIWNIVHGR